MKINENADLQILFDYGWESNLGGPQGVYYKDLAGYGGVSEISLVINPFHHPKGGFIIYSTIYQEVWEDDTSVNMFEILEEVENLKRLRILV